MVHHGSFELVLVCHNVNKPSKSLYIEGGGFRHCGFEAVGRTAMEGRSLRRDRYARWIYDPREKS